jgi:uncharacterized protein
MKYVVFYEPGGDRAKAPELFPEHQAHYQRFAERGLLLMIGPFVDQSEGAISVFTTREAAEEFVRGDPFVLGGVVKSWRIAEWREALVP